MSETTREEDRKVGLVWHNPAEQPATHVLVIGVSSYQHSDVPWVASPVRSARAFADWFLDKQPSGFNNPMAPLGSLAVLLSEHKNGAASTFLNGPVPRANFENTKAAVRAWRQRAEAGDHAEDNLLVLFVVSHGESFGRRTAFLLEDYKMDEDDIRSGMSEVEQLAEAVANLKPKAQLLIFDCCRLPTSAKLGFDKELGKSLLDRAQRPDPRQPVVLRSAALGEAAYGDDKGLTIFSQALLDAGRGLAASSSDNWVINSYSLAQTVANLVRLRRKDGEPLQRPNSVLSEQFPISVINEITETQAFISVQSDHEFRRIRFEELDAGRNLLRTVPANDLGYITLTLANGAPRWIKALGPADVLIGETKLMPYPPVLFRTLPDRMSISLPRSRSIARSTENRPVGEAKIDRVLKTIQTKDSKPGFERRDRSRIQNYIGADLPDAEATFTPPYVYPFPAPPTTAAPHWQNDEVDVVITVTQPGAPPVLNTAVATLIADPPSKTLPPATHVLPADGTSLIVRAKAGDYRLVIATASGAIETRHFTAEPEEVEITLELPATRNEFMAMAVTGGVVDAAAAEDNAMVGTAPAAEDLADAVTWVSQLALGNTMFSHRIGDKEIFATPVGGIDPLLLIQSEGTTPPVTAVTPAVKLQAGPANGRFGLIAVDDWRTRPYLPRTVKPGDRPFWLAVAGAGWRELAWCPTMGLGTALLRESAGEPDPWQVEVVVDTRPAIGSSHVGAVVRSRKNTSLLAFLGRRDFASGAAIVTEMINNSHVEFGPLDGTSNPLALTAMALLLLGAGKAKTAHISTGWLENLATTFPLLPDGPVLLARTLRQQQQSRHTGVSRDLLLEAVRRGVPAFSLTLDWLVEELTFLEADPKYAKAAADFKRLARLSDPNRAFTVLRII